MSERDKDKNRRDKQRNLQARTEGDGEAKIHLVFHRHLYCHQVLGNVTNDRHEDNTDEELAKPKCLAYSI